MPYTTNNSALNTLVSAKKSAKSALINPSNFLPSFPTPKDPIKDEVDRLKNIQTSVSDYRPDNVPKTEIRFENVEEEAAPAKTTPTNDAYQSAISELASGVKGEGLSGTNAAIAQGRQSLAAATKQAEARAGLQAQEAGALGQGTATSMQQQVRQSALSELSGQELGFAQLRGQDQKDAIDRTILAEQWEKGFEADEAQRYMNNALELSVDNPVFAKKIQDFVLEGKTGKLGAFTPEEVTEIERLKGETEKREEQADNLYSKTLDLITAQTEQANRSVTGEMALEGEQNTRIDNFLNNGDWEGMTTDDFVNMNSTQRAKIQEQSVDIMKDNTGQDGWSHDEDVSNSSAETLWKAQNPISADPDAKGKYFNHNGVVYIITNPFHVATVDSDSREIQVLGINTETGKEEMIIHSSDYEIPWL